MPREMSGVLMMSTNELLPDKNALYNETCIHVLGIAAVPTLMSTIASPYLAGSAFDFILVTFTCHVPAASSGSMACRVCVA